ncbi:hypothetical protein FAI41_04620 [Acetobacteraceae bacterium]|nr:hypothetical protein FAI41_04620 [Acetobacteraceae bacterium]
MTEKNTTDLSTIGELLKQLVEQGKKEAHPMKDFIEAGNKFKDAASSLQSFLGNFLSDAQTRILGTVRLQNLSDFTGLPTNTLFTAGKIAAIHGGSESEAGDLAKHLMEINLENPKELKDLQKLGVDGLFTRKGLLDKDFFSKIQEAFQNQSIIEQHELLKQLGLNENGLGAAFLAKEMSLPQKEVNKNSTEALLAKAAPQPGNFEANSTLLRKDTLTNAFFDKAHLDEIKILAPSLEKVADSFNAIARSHPELVAEGLLSIHSAILLLSSANVALTGAVLASKALPAAKLTSSALKTGAKAAGGFAARQAPNIAKAGVALGGLGLGAFEGLGAGIAELAGLALLPGIAIPLAIGGAVVGGGAFALYEWQKHHQKLTTKAQDAPEIATLTTQADQGQEIKITNAQQQGAYFQTLRQKEKQGFGNRPLSLSFGNINVTTQEDDDPFAFAEAVKSVVSEELMKVLVSFGPYR